MKIGVKFIIYFLYAMLLIECIDKNQFNKFLIRSFEVSSSNSSIKNSEVVHCHLTNLLNYSVHLDDFIIEHKPNDDILEIEIYNHSFLHSRKNISDLMEANNLFILPKEMKIIPISIVVKKTTDVILVFNKKDEGFQQEVVVRVEASLGKKKRRVYY